MKKIVSGSQTTINIDDEKLITSGVVIACLFYRHSLAYVHVLAEVEVGRWYWVQMSSPANSPAQRNYPTPQAAVRAMHEVSRDTFRFDNMEEFATWAKSYY